MAKGFRISFEGLEQTIRELKSTVSDIEEKVDFAIGVNVEAMATEAKNRAPVEDGRLRNSISASKDAKFKYELVAGVYYAPYIEFGTGKYAATYVQGIDPEWSKLALQFYVNGMGKIPAQPYLYPAYKRIFPIMVKDIQNLVNKDVRL
jgi:HK97 gp10 family phage protein